MNINFKNTTSPPWKVFIKGCVVEIQDRDGNPVIGWPGFDDSRRPLKEHIANAKLIVNCVNKTWRE